MALSILYKYQKLCIGMDLIHLGPLNNLCVVTLNLYENLQLLVRQDIKDCPKSVHTPFKFTLKNESFGPQTSQYENVGNLDEGQNGHFSSKSNVIGERLFFDQKYMVF